MVADDVADANGFVLGGGVVTGGLIIFDEGGAFAWCSRRRQILFLATAEHWVVE
jgi:hypothetical protein